MTARAAGVLVRARNSGRVLLCRRSADGWWAMPGGHLHEGEEAAEAAVRELREETGIYVRDVSLLFVTRHPLVLYIGFEATIPAEIVPRLDYEHREWGWFHPWNPPQPLHPGLVGVQLW